jgi:hypothetical protein
MRGKTIQWVFIAPAAQVIESARRTASAFGSRKFVSGMGARQQSAGSTPMMFVAGVGKVLSVLVLGALLTACASVLGSDAYRLGQESGRELRELKGQTEALNSWLEDEDEGSTLTSKDIRDFCENAWFLVGMANGMTNTPDNEKDFIAGCKAAALD